MPDLATENYFFQMAQGLNTNIIDSYIIIIKGAVVLFLILGNQDSFRPTLTEFDPLLAPNHILRQKE